MDWSDVAMRWVLVALTVLLIMLHQDFWNWNKVEPAFGFLPVALWYHALFCVAASVLMALFVAAMWPRHLESAEESPPPDRDLH